MIMDVFKDVAFWGPLFGFLTAIVGCIRWLMRAAFVYKLKSVEAKKIADEQKSARDTQLLKTLNETLSRIVPVVEKHSTIIKTFESTASKVFISESRIAISVKENEALAKELGIKMGNLGSSLMNTNLVVKDLVPRLDKIETEIIKIKNDWVFVRTKKP